MPGYRVLDIRGRFCPAHSSWGNSSKGAGVVLHYAGDPVPQWAWNEPLRWIKLICELHSQPGRFAPNWTINGSAYTEFCFAEKIYRVRNYAADLPHCGHLYHNRNSLSLHIPVGGNQRPQQVGQGTMLTALRRADDHLKAMGLGRQSLYGHRELNPSLCPGEPVMASIQNYRSGADLYDQEDEPKADDPPVQSAPSGTVFRVIAGAFGEKSNAQTRANQIKAKGFGEPWIYKHGSVHRVQVGSFSDPASADDLVVRLKAAKFEAYALAEKS